MTTVEALLHEPPFAELAARREVTREQLAAFFDVLEVLVPSASQGEADFLEANAGLSDRVRHRLRHVPQDERVLMTQVHVTSMARLLAGSWDAAEVQRRSGKSHSTVSRWNTSGKVYSFEGETGRRYPQWQFIPAADGCVAPVPGLGAVLEVLPDGVAPLAFEAFMTAGHPALGGAAPIEVLAEHGDVDRVATVVRDEWGRGR